MQSFERTVEYQHNNALATLQMDQVRRPLNLPKPLFRDVITYVSSKALHETLDSLPVPGVLSHWRAR